MRASSFTVNIEVASAYPVIATQFINLITRFMRGHKRVGLLINCLSFIIPSKLAIHGISNCYDTP